jgi:fatty-acid desaturase
MENTNLPQKNYFQSNQVKYIWAFVPLVLTFLGNTLGNGFILLPFVFLLALIPLDFILKSKTKVEIKDEKILSNNILLGVAGMQVLITISFLANFVASSNSFGWFTPIAIIVNGLALGLAISGGAHELIHRREQNLKDIGTFQMSLLGYGHNTTEHIQGHHRNIGYSSDPSTCAKGINFYQYFVHGLVEEFKDGWKIEVDRLTKKNISPFTIQNSVFKWLVVSGVFALFVLISCGFLGLFVYILTCLVAIAFHSAVVYSQHYGLTRSEGQRVDDTLSWQTDSLITELFVLGFGNHSDHHTRVTKTYSEIVLKENGPNMPCGYFGIIPLVLIPKIWFSTVDKLIPKQNI